MARPNLCDPKLVLDPHKKLEEKRAPLKSWANTSMGKDRRQQARRPDMAMDCIEENGHRHDERGTDSTILLQYGSLDMAPSLLMRDMEVAMEKLGLTFVKIYALDIFCDMMRKQSSYALQSPELPSGFTSCTRAILVDWLIQVHDAFHYSEETLYLTVHLLNRCMRSCRVSIATFQLLGMACLFIASKREECLLPEVSELCFLMENTYSKKQLLRMERHVLKELKYDLSYCYPLHFLLLSGTITRYSAQVLWMARYFLELTLLEPQCLVFQPVQLASAALCLACRVLQGQLFPASERAWMTAGSIYICSERTAQRILHYIARLVMRAGASETQATFLKFSSVTRLQVSLHPCLQSVLPLLGLL
ncbi:cyclin-P isoform X1 [Lepisosteus oculatus]|uniref:cyclin-P isoform X1 n=1 Tax=Lepisosteus oculatus TaxID=7918 RepID=UPI0007404728|nr:PREDICTED: cyclin N-terminal domain-containing protein 2 isoform X1 [Lepisosteus oculatus]